MKYRAIRLTVLLLLSTAGFAADGPAATKAKFVQAQRRNAEFLRQYSWIARTEVTENGQKKSIKTESVRYNAVGQLQKAPVDNGSANAGSKNAFVENSKPAFTGLVAELV